MLNEFSSASSEGGKLTSSNLNLSGDIGLNNSTITNSSSISSNSEQQNYLQADFFTALERLQEIERECKTLLRTQHQRIAMEILDEMALIEEAAFRRLYKWFRNECRKLNSLYPFFYSPSAPNSRPLHSSSNTEATASNSPISPLFRDAIEALKSKPVLLGYCVDEITTTRNKVIVKTFLSALSQHKSSITTEDSRSPVSGNKPIEIHAHDPIRYVGDMLAWIHQSLANESELLQAVLFSSQSSSTSNTNSQLNNFNTNEQTDNKSKIGEEESTFHEILSTYKILDAIFEGVCRPFKVRVEQVILSITANYQTNQSNSKNKNSAVLAYRLANLFHFYSKTVQKIMNSLYTSYISNLHSTTVASIPPSSILVTTIEE